MGDGTQVRASGQSVGMAGRALLLALEQRAPRQLLVCHPAALHLTLCGLPILPLQVWCTLAAALQLPWGRSCLARGMGGTTLAL